MEPKVGNRIPGMTYDTLMPEDIEPYLNGRSWKDLKVGDEFAFPEPSGVCIIRELHIHSSLNMLSLTPGIPRDLVARVMVFRNR